MENETKLCKHCKSEIPKTAKVCPQCRKKQGGVLKWVAIVIVVLVLIGSFGSSNENSSASKEDNSVQNVSNQSATSNTSIETDKEESQVIETESVDYIVAGESFEVRDLVVSVNEISTDFTDYEDEFGIYTPEEGKKYIMASFTFQNNGDSDTYVSIYDFDCYADGTLCEQTYYFGGEFINGNISAGRNVSFATHYVVPVDATEIELEYTSNMWTSEKVIIKVQ